VNFIPLVAIYWCFGYFGWASVTRDEEVYELYQWWAIGWLGVPDWMIDGEESDHERPKD